MKSKIFTFFLALIVSVGSIFAESGTCGDNLTWDITDGALTISGTGDMWNYALVHFAPWYSYRSSIKSIILNDGVTSIGDYAFACCNRLTSVNIPTSVISLGNGAFHDCTSLTSITIPDSVISVGSSAFNGSSGLTSITIGKSVTSIGDQAFYNCSNLVSVNFKGSVTNIVGNYIFYNCSNLTNIYAACGDLERLTQVLNDIRVKYAPLPYTISTVAKNGYVSLPQNECEPLELEAIPDKGYHFVKWSDGNTDNPRTIVLTQDTTISAEFAINIYLVQFFGYDNVLLDSQSVIHEKAAVAPEAPAIEHYEFIGWDKEFTNVTSNLDIYAIYQEINDLENIVIDSFLHKVMINGQIFILRGDRIYTLTGQEVK